MWLLKDHALRELGISDELWENAKMQDFFSNHAPASLVPAISISNEHPNLHHFLSAFRFADVIFFSFCPSSNCHVPVITSVKSWVIPFMASRGLRIHYKYARDASLMVNAECSIVVPPNSFLKLWHASVALDYSCPRDLRVLGGNKADVKDLGSRTGAGGLLNSKV